MFMRNAWYVAASADLAAAGVDEIWCISVNDAFVMGAWGRDQKTAGKVRMMADGSADFAKATGLTLDLTARGLGLRTTAEGVENPAQAEALLELGCDYAQGWHFGHPVSADEFAARWLVQAAAADERVR